MKHINFKNLILPILLGFLQPLWSQSQLLPKITEINLSDLKSKKITSASGEPQEFKFTAGELNDTITNAFHFIFRKLIEGRQITKVKKKKIYINKNYENLWVPPLDWDRFLKIQKDNPEWCLNYIVLENEDKGFIMNRSSRSNEGLYFLDQSTLKKATVKTLENFNKEAIRLHQSKEKYNKDLITSLAKEKKAFIDNLGESNWDFQTMYVKYVEMNEKHGYWYTRIIDSVIITNWLGEEECSKYMKIYEKETTLKAAREQWYKILGNEYKKELSQFLKLQVSDKYLSKKYNSSRVYKKLFEVDKDIQKNIPTLQLKIDSVASDYVKNNYGNQYLELVNDEELNESRYYPGLKYNQNYVYFKVVPSPKETSLKIYSKDTLKGKSLFGPMSFSASLKASSISNKRELNTDYWIKKRLDKSPKFYCIGGLIRFSSYLGNGSNFNPTADSTILKFKERILPITTKSYHSIGRVLKSQFYGTITEKAQFVFSENPYLRVKAERSNTKFARLCDDCVCDFDSAQLVTRVIDYKKTRDVFEQQAAEMKAKEEAEAKAAEQKQKSELYAKYGKKYVDAAYEGEIITGMHEDLVNVIVSKMYYVSSSTELGNGATKYWLRPNNSSATINLIITIKNKKVTRVSTWRR